MYLYIAAAHQEQKSTNGKRAGLVEGPVLACLHVCLSPKLRDLKSSSQKAITSPRYVVETQPVCVCRFVASPRQVHTCDNDTKRVTPDLLCT